MTWRNNRYRVAPIGGADRSDRCRMANLRGDLTVGARLAERNGQEGGPDFFLEFAADKFQFQVEAIPRAGEILIELPRGLHEDRIVRGFAHRSQPHPVRFVVFPEDGRESAAVRDQLQLTDRRGQGDVRARHDGDSRAGH